MAHLLSVVSTSALALFGGPLAPSEASTFAPGVDEPMLLVMGVAVAAALGVLGLILAIIRTARAKGRTQDETASRAGSSAQILVLELSWTVIPLVAVLGLFGWGLNGYLDARVAPKDAMEIRVEAKLAEVEQVNAEQAQAEQAPAEQVEKVWKWHFTYPSGLVDTELHVPVDQDVRLVLVSADVVRTLTIPAFRVKMDAVPGRYTELWFRPTLDGEYSVDCVKPCGDGEADMQTTAVVHQAGGFEKWVNDKQPSLDDMDPVVLGEMLYEQQACKTCHSVDGSALVGPSWQGLFGKERTFTDGSTTTADAEYIKNSLRAPSDQVVDGFTPSMPTYDESKLNEQQINAIVEYIKTLK